MKYQRSAGGRTDGCHSAPVSQGVLSESARSLRVSTNDLFLSNWVQDSTAYSRDSHPNPSLRGGLHAHRDTAKTAFLRVISAQARCVQHLPQAHSPGLHWQLADIIHQPGLKLEQRDTYVVPQAQAAEPQPWLAGISTVCYKVNRSVRRSLRHITRSTHSEHVNRGSVEC